MIADERVAVIRSADTLCDGMRAECRRRRKRKKKSGKARLYEEKKTTSGLGRVSHLAASCSQMAKLMLWWNVVVAVTGLPAGGQNQSSRIHGTQVFGKANDPCVLGYTCALCYVCAMLSAVDGPVSP